MADPKEIDMGHRKLSAMWQRRTVVDPRVLDALRKSDLSTAEHRAQIETENRIIGQMLTGRAHIMGRPVRVEWPQGRPDGMTDDELREFGEQLLRQAGSDDGQ